MIYHINKPDFKNAVPNTIEPAIEAAIEAGLAILKVDQNQLDIKIKKDNTPVTIADNISNQIINNHLNKTNIPIISEEDDKVSFAERSSYNKYWLVDPLDGTKEFIRHGDEYCVSIALMVENRPKYGIIFAPALNEIWVGGLGIGVYYGKCVSKQHTDFQVNWERATDIKNSRSPIAVVSRSDSNKPTLGTLVDIKKKFPLLEIETCASAIKLARISTGAYSIHFKKGKTMEWDTAAAHALIIETGGDIVDYSGNKSLLYNKALLENPFFIAYNRAGIDLLPNV